MILIQYHKNWTNLMTNPKLCLIPHFKQLTRFNFSSALCEHFWKTTASSISLAPVIMIAKQNNFTYKAA